jgi:hypothetical protein
MNAIEYLNDMVKCEEKLSDITAEKLIELMNSSDLTANLYIAVEKEFIRRLQE